jgi:hypothetical protein
VRQEVNMMEIRPPYEVCPVLAGESLVLRLVRQEDAGDLRSDFETEATLEEQIGIVEAHFPAYFAYRGIVTRAVPPAEERIRVLRGHGFTPLRDRSIMSFDDYYFKPHGEQPRAGPV